MSVPRRDGVPANRILAILALANLVSYAARNALFTVYPDLHVRFGIDEAEFGFLQTVFMIPHAAATLAFGWAGDHYPRRRVIAVGLVIASVAGAAATFGSSYVGLTVSRAFVGLGTAAIVPVANSILGQLFEGPRKASHLAIFNVGLFLGGVVGFGAGIALGFPLVVLALALPGLALAALVATLPVPPRPVVPKLPPSSSAAYMLTLRGTAQRLLRITTLRWVLASTALMAFAAGSFNAWLSELLTRPAPGGKGMSKESALTLLIMALFAGLSGILFGARLADWLRSWRVSGPLWSIVLGMAISAPCAAIAITVPAGVGLYAAGIATMFFMSWYHAPMAATVDDLAPPALAVSAQGLVIFAMHMIGTAPSAWIVGWVAKRTLLPTALWIPTGAIVLAALAMAMATRTFAADQGRARPGTVSVPSL